MKWRTVALVGLSFVLYVLLPCTASGADRPRFKVRAGMSPGWLPKEDVSRFAFSTNRGASFSDVVNGLARAANASVYWYAWGDASLYVAALSPLATGNTFPFYAEGGASASARGVPWNGSAAVEVKQGIWIEAHVAKSERRALSLAGSSEYGYVRKVSAFPQIAFRPAVLAEVRHMRDDESRMLESRVMVLGLECIREVGAISRRATFFAGGGVEHWTLLRHQTGAAVISEYRPFAVLAAPPSMLAAPPEDARTEIRSEAGTPLEQAGVIRPYVATAAEFALARGLAAVAELRIYTRGASTKLPPVNTRLFGTVSPAADLPQSTLTFSLGYTF